MLDFLTLYTSFGVLILRLVYGYIFLSHGSQKLFGGLSGTAQFFEQIGLKPGAFWARVVGTIEFVGGIAIVLGLLTQWVALLLAVIMIVAIAKVKGKQGLVGGYEFDLLLLAVSVLFLFSGAGEYGMDYFLFR